MGEVLISGRDILGPAVDVAELRYRVGMVFQKATPFPMSVFDNVAFGLRLAEGMRGAELKARVESALQDAAIWDEVKDKLHADGRSLSGGQQQRLCVARTIAVQPEVLLLDEPTAALDPISTLKVEETLQALREKYCIVIVTHNLQQAARVSNVTGFMYLGELVEIGPSNEIFTAPKTARPTITSPAASAERERPAVKAADESARFDRRRSGAASGRMRGRSRFGL